MTIPANLIVLSIFRLGQIGLMGFLFLKAYNFTVDSSFDLTCRTTSKGTVNYTVQFPFQWIAVTGLSDCSSTPTETTTYVTTNFGMPSGMFMVVTAASLVYCVGAVFTYFSHWKMYDYDKKLPAADLLMSLILGLFWVMTCYFAWSNYPTFKESSTAERVTASIPVCQSDSAGGWCSTGNSSEQFGDVKTFMFLGLASALFWGISVWFIFMEGGLVPDDDEEYDGELTDEDLAYDYIGEGGKVVPRTFVPFSRGQIDGKADLYQKEFGFDADKVAELGAPDQVMMEAQQQQFMEYLANWQSQTHKPTVGDNDYDRFAHGLTFSPQVSTISGQEYERDVMGTKVHSKWNLFKA